jgi:hypothetical protein
MKKFLALAACALACAALGAAAALAGNPSIGFAEDMTKYAPDGGDALFQEMNNLGTNTNRVAVFWDAGNPGAIFDQSFLDRMIPVAQKHNIQVVFAIYPLKATMAPTTPDAVSSFCDYAVKAMARYPYVRKVVIGNEPNQPRFWQPIWNGKQPASPAAMEAVMASCYDKLKAFDSSLDVIAVGLSPRGNDAPPPANNSSISPVRWIKAFGAAYRASGRTKPLFDEWSWHCYPNINTDAVEVGYFWPSTGCVNAARVKLALWDAFHGTAQPVLPGYPPSTTGATLFRNTSRMFIDETGWQVDTSGKPGYVNNENVPPVSEATQAQIYEKLVHLANCEPTLSAFHIFHEIDESDRLGFQSGVLRVTGEERASAADPVSSVKHAISADGGSCHGGVWAKLGSFLFSTSAVVPSYAKFAYSGKEPYADLVVSGGGRYVELQAGEGFSYVLTFKKGAAKKMLKGSAPKTTATAKVPGGFGGAGGTVTVKLSAEMNPGRTSTVTLPLG